MSSENKSDGATVEKGIHPQLGEAQLSEQRNDGMLVGLPINTNSLTKASIAGVFKELSLLDRLLTPIILLAMVVGVLIGVFVPGVQKAFDTVSLNGVSVRELNSTQRMVALTNMLSEAIAIGLLVMMWPILTKVHYESLPILFRSKTMWKHVLISLFLNWIIGPLIMVGLAWATLPDLPTYRTGSSVLEYSQVT